MDWDSLPSFSSVVAPNTFVGSQISVRIGRDSLASISYKDDGRRRHRRRRSTRRAAWGPPLMISIGGGSFGTQIGGQETDYVLVVMNPKGMEQLLKSKFTLGADASVAAGPKGRTASAATDASMHAEILAYSRARGLFVGISLEGAVVKQDQDGNRRVYGEDVTPRELLFEPGQGIPAAGQGLVDTLNAVSPRKVSRLQPGR